MLTRVPGAAVVALALPFVFLHRDYLPSWSVDVGSTSATAFLSDVAVACVLVAGVVALARRGPGPLRPGLAVLLPSAFFLALVFAATAYGRALDDEYRAAEHLVTALKLLEYALLAVAVPLLVRRRADFTLVLWSLSLWGMAMTAVGVLQFLGLVDEFEGRRPGQREPSYLGIHDFAALSGATLAVGLGALAFGPHDRRERALALVAGASGAIGLALSGAVAGWIGVAAAATVAALVALRRGRLSRRRAAAIVAVLAAVGAGVFALRTGDFSDFLRFVGAEKAEEGETLAGASYAQRSVLAYIGFRIFLDHPVAGAGWQASSELGTYGPHLEDARRRFPDVPASSFPAPEHPWGIQNAYVQALAELGVVGFLALLGVFAAGLALAVRASLRAPPEHASTALVPALWLLVVMGVWLGVGLVAGVPLVGLHWLALGLAVAAPGCLRA